LSMHPLTPQSHILTYTTLFRSAISLSEADRRLVLKRVIEPVLNSLRWPNRPRLPRGASCWASDTIESPEGSFVVFVSDLQKRPLDRKNTRLNSSHVKISYAVYC